MKGYKTLISLLLMYSLLIVANIVYGISFDKPYTTKQNVIDLTRYSCKIMQTFCIYTILLYPKNFKVIFPFAYTHDISVIAYIIIQSLLYLTGSFDSKDSLFLWSNLAMSITLNIVNNIFLVLEKQGLTKNYGRLVIFCLTVIIVLLNSYHLNTIVFHKLFFPNDEYNILVFLKIIVTLLIISFKMAAIYFSDILVPDRVHDFMSIIARTIPFDLFEAIDRNINSQLFIFFF